MTWVPAMERVMAGRELRSITLGHPLVDAYLEFVGARGAVNTWLGDAGVDRNPVPRGLAGRRAGQRGRGGVRLVRRPRTEPRVLSPVESTRC
jgi:hypothetical protein